jgi:hypothetical protein
VHKSKLKIVWGMALLCWLSSLAIAGGETVKPRLNKATIAIL